MSISMLNRSVGFLLLVLALSASAQQSVYPSRAIRLIDPFPPGGAVDLVTRSMAQKLSEALGQPVVSENKPGAGTNIGTEAAVRATPDGYTLLITSSAVATNVSLFKKLPFDPVRDLAPVGLLVQTPLILAVNPTVPVKSVQELIDLAKASPGRVVYGSSGTGSSGHLSVELFRTLANIDLLHVPYKGGAPALLALMAGEVQVNIGNITVALPQAKAGKIRALAITSATRVELAPDLPTVAEAGVPGYEAIGWYAMFAPAGTPQAIVNRLNAEINKILKTPDVRERFLGVGMVPLGGSAQELADYHKVEIARWAKVIKAANIKPE